MATEHLPTTAKLRDQIKGNERTSTQFILLKDLTVGALITLEACDALTGEKRKISMSLTDPNAQLFQFKGAPFHFYRLDGSQNEFHEVKEGEKLMPFAVGELVKPNDVRRLHHTMPQSGTDGLDFAVEIVRDGVPQFFAAHDISRLLLPIGIPNLAI